MHCHLPRKSNLTSDIQKKIKNKILSNMKYGYMPIKYYHAKYHIPAYA